MFKRIINYFLHLFKSKSRFKLEKVREELIKNNDGTYEESFIDDSSIDETLIDTEKIENNPFEQYRTIDRRIEKWRDCIICNRKLFVKGWQKKIIKENDDEILQCGYCKEKYKIINKEIE